MKIQYLGEREDGSVCSKCGGRGAEATITRKKIFGRLWEINRPQEVNINEFDRYMATGLFIKV